jgi:hypothetical protein
VGKLEMGINGRDKNGRDKKTKKIQGEGFALCFD